jgi:hypothetical protein
VHSPTRIFLASSSELRAERELFQLRCNNKNKLWHGDGIFLHVDVWEDFIDSLSRTRSQDEYNAAIRQADIFVLLVHTKVGKYSREELEAAMRHFDATGKPRIYIYFKQPANPSAPGPEYQTVRDLKAHLAQLDQFPPQPYEHVAEMLDHFNQQLDKLRDAGFIRPAKAESETLQSTTGHRVLGSGALAVGTGTQAASAGGVVIGGSNHAPVNTGHTGGGAVFFGAVTAGRDVVGRDKIEVVSRHAADNAELAPIVQQLAALQAQLQALASRPDQPLVAELMQGLQDEISKPEGKRKPELVKHLLEGLVDLVPAGVAAVASAFASPLLAGVAGPAAQALLARWRGKPEDPT